MVDLYVYRVNDWYLIGDSSFVTWKINLSSYQLFMHFHLIEMNWEGYQRLSLSRVSTHNMAIVHNTRNSVPYSFFEQCTDSFTSRRNVDATGSELFSYLTCLHTATFILLRIFSPVEPISLKSLKAHYPGMRNAHLRFRSVPQKRRLLKLWRVKREGLRFIILIREESLAISRCNCKGSIFYLVIQRPWELVRPGIEPTTSHTVVRHSMISLAHLFGQDVREDSSIVYNISPDLLLSFEW